MTNICLYFQVHQPYRLAKYSIFDIGTPKTYLDHQKNNDVARKVAQKCYLPTNQIINELINKNKDFKVTYSITGTALSQFQETCPTVLDSFRRLADTGRVEFLSETFHHSLAFLYDKQEFREQVKLHYNTIKKLFGQKPQVFRNTELIYNNDLAFFTENLGYKAILAEGADNILQGRSPNHVYKPKNTRNIKLLLKNYRLSDDVAFRFSNKTWSGWPLTATKFVNWLTPLLGDTINLFMDYETFGEHHWADTGIFNFLKSLPSECTKKKISFHTPTELAQIPAKEELDVPFTTSWADLERDLSAWLGNRMQCSAIEQLYQLKNDVFKTENPELIEMWRKLTTSDHFYYMCTKYFSDGDVHKYFNPYDSPYDCFIAFMNVLQDLALRVKPKETTEWIKIS